MLPTDPKLSMCGVFLYVVTQLGSTVKGTVAKHGFARSAPQKAVGIWKRGASMVVTCQWELSELGGEISELWVRESAEMRTGQPASRCLASIVWIAFLKNISHATLSVFIVIYD